MPSSLLSFNGLRSKTNQETNKLGKLFLGQLRQNWGVLWETMPPDYPRCALPISGRMGSLYSRKGELGTSLPQVQLSDMAAILGGGHVAVGGGVLMIVLCYWPPITAL